MNSRRYVSRPPQEPVTNGTPASVTNGICAGDCGFLVCEHDFIDSAQHSPSPADSYPSPADGDRHPACSQSHPSDQELRRPAGRRRPRSLHPSRRSRRFPRTQRGPARRRRSTCCSGSADPMRDRSRSSVCRLGGRSLSDSSAPSCRPAVFSMTSPSVKPSTTRPRSSLPPSTPTFSSNAADGPALM